MSHDNENVDPRYRDLPGDPHYIPVPLRRADPEPKPRKVPREETTTPVRGER